MKRGRASEQAEEEGCRSELERTKRSFVGARRTLLIARFVMQIPAEPVSVFPTSSSARSDLVCRPGRRRDPINSPPGERERESSTPPLKDYPSNSLPSIEKTLRVLQRSLSPSLLSCIHPRIRAYVSRNLRIMLVCCVIMTF